MPTTVNVPVLVGPVQLLYVQSMTINEGYRIERIMGSKFSQAIAPTTKTISIEAMLIGPDRLLLHEAIRANQHSLDADRLRRRRDGLRELAPHDAFDTIAFVDRHALDVEQLDGTDQDRDVDGGGHRRLPVILSLT